MEAVGAAAAIAELSGLSLRTGKAVKNLMQSFVHAPAEITELNDKIDRLYSLMQQIGLLCAELPAGDSDVLFPPQHRALISLSLQRTLDSLMGLKSSGQTRNQNGVRERMRWAAMDKRKAQRFLESIQEAESELDFPLQVLTIRLVTINQNSVAAVAAGQARLQVAIAKSAEDIKYWVSQELSQLQIPGTRTGNSGTIIPTRAYNAQNLLRFRDEKDDPVQRLVEHDIKRTLNYHEASIGSTSRELEFENGWSNLGAAAVFRRKRNSTKIQLLLSLGCKLFGATILRGELQVSIDCRLWKLQPHIATSITALNLRPTDSPIFVACRQRDLNQVRYLLHTGEASIYDVDEAFGGLLEHVVYSKTDVIGYQEDEEKFLHSGQRLLEYLLDQGCDAGLYLEGSKTKRPAVLGAFKYGFTAAVSSMMTHGADLNDFGNQPGGLLGQWLHESALVWQIGLLRSLGYSDWQASESMDNLLYGACNHCQMDLVCFALEVAGIDPNLTGELGRAPIGNAAAIEWLEGVAVLAVAGARINIGSQSWNGTPLIQSIERFRILTGTSHFLLLQGANPNICRSEGISAWGMLWTSVFLPGSMVGRHNLSFVDFGSSLAHLLHHGADPFEIVTTRVGINSLGFLNSRHWFDEIGYVRASDISIFFSQGVEEREQAEAIFKDIHWAADLREELKGELLLSGDDLKNFHWNYHGDVYRVKDDVYAEYMDSYTSETECSGATELSPIEPAGHIEYGSPSIATSNHVDKPGQNQDMADAHEYSSEEDSLSDSASSIDDAEDEEFRLRFDATRFYHHITNKKGRRQLSRFPLTRALCDALQHSGFRAEMDDEGDIWYDCDDGDRYFDAWEYQDDDQDDETWLPKACPICQDFEGYGLGHILEIAERARAQYYEYKDKVKQGKMSMCL